MPKKKVKFDYKSNNGFMTSVWGPAAWHFIHFVSLNYPVKPTREQKQHYYDFIINLQNILPCGICRKNMTKNLKKFPLLKSKHMKSRATFSKWVYEFHKEVSTMLKKDSKLTYKQSRDKYEMFRATCGKTEPGCIKPVNYVKSKCVINIVPQTDETQTFIIDGRCFEEKK